MKGGRHKVCILAGRIERNDRLGSYVTIKMVQQE